MPKERKIDMVILGLLSHEDLTGYEIKKRIDGAISFFWKGSFGSIYPSLQAMEKDGLVRRFVEESTDNRERIRYSITENGRVALSEWLKDSKVTNDLKYETLLKLFFGGATDKEVSVKTIENFKEDVEKDLAVLKVYEANLKKVLNEEHMYYYLTVCFGIKTYEAYLIWCEDSLKILNNI